VTRSDRAGTVPSSAQPAGDLPVVVAIGLLAAARAAESLDLSRGSVILLPAAAGSVVVLARRSGASWSELGMGEQNWRSIARYAAVEAGIVVGTYACAAVVPATRAAFLDSRYAHGLGRASTVALVRVPFGTVLPEEIAFRGVLWGLVRRNHGSVWATLVSSALFGCWHIGPSLPLGEANRAVGALAGSSGRGQSPTVVSAVVFTGLAGAVLCELRRRSGSLLAPAGLHWATNGLGVLLASAVWRLSRRGGVRQLRRQCDRVA
jgi:uncharacterized protein